MVRKTKSDAESAENVAREVEQARHDEMPDSDYSHRPSAFDHYVARARGLDPAGVVGRDEPAETPTKPQPPYSR